MSKYSAHFLPETGHRTALCGIGLVLISCVPPATAAESATQKLARAFVTSGDAKAPECNDALLLAKSLPRTHAPDSRAALVLPPAMRSTLALGRPPDATQSSVLQASDDFERLSLPDHQYAYWAKRIEAGKRIAVVTYAPTADTEFYSLHVLDAAVTLADFRAAAESGEFFGRDDRFFSDRISPLLFTLPTSGATWLLMIDPQVHHLQTWHVYARPVTRHLCNITVRFDSDVQPPRVVVN